MKTFFDKFDKLFDMSIELLNERATQSSTNMNDLGKFRWLQAYKTLDLSVPRQVGKTHYIQRHFNPFMDILVCYNEAMRLDAYSPYRFDRCFNILTKYDLEDGLRYQRGQHQEEPIRYIWLDEVSSDYLYKTDSIYQLDSIFNITGDTSIIALRSTF